jgi:hypothetical protein
MADKRTSDENEQQDDTMNCGLSIAERDVLQERLRELPDTMPPRAVWQHIEAQARAEGLFSGHRRQEKMKWFAGAGLAAAVALMVLRFPLTPPIDDPVVFPTEPTYDEVLANNGPATLSNLMVRSSQLERNLRALPEQPRLARAGTVATISDLEDRIAEIDFWLNHPDVVLSQQESEIYWRERVRLMNSLLWLRMAQAQRMAF